MFSDDLKTLFLNDIPFIDVRAPIEFTQGHLPKAECLPILNDAEREAVGTVYKQKGQLEAVKLGHQLISGSVREERLAKWVLFKSKNPNVVLYCFRGGQRSALSQQWMAEAGCEIQRLEGGYKVARQFLTEQSDLCANQIQFLVLAGLTGSGKTTFLNEIKVSYPILDLESIAKHRGSAFGGFTQPQPSQATFENVLAVELLKLDSKAKVDPRRVLVEDESRMIGKRNLPTKFYTKLRESAVIFLDVELEQRVQNIFDEYICGSHLGKLEMDKSESAETAARQVFASFKNAVNAISSRLGGLRSQELMASIEKAELQTFKYKNLEENKVWIKKLLTDYYDPLYTHSLDRRSPNIILNAKKSECLLFLSGQKL